MSLFFFFVLRSICIQPKSLDLILPSLALRYDLIIFLIYSYRNGIEIGPYGVAICTRIIHNAWCMTLISSFLYTQNTSSLLLRCFTLRLTFQPIVWELMAIKQFPSSLFNDCYSLYHPKKGFNTCQEKFILELRHIRMQYF